MAVSLSVSASTLQNNTYDYIVVGGGPAGLITAVWFAEACKKILVLERGVGPTVATGTKATLVWNNTLIPVDVSGLSANLNSFDIWDKYICNDTAGYAACVLGGGVPVNSYLKFKQID